MSPVAGSSGIGAWRNDSVRRCHFNGPDGSRSVSGAVGELERVCSVSGRKTGCNLSLGDSGTLFAGSARKDISANDSASEVSSLLSFEGRARCQKKRSATNDNLVVSVDRLKNRKVELIAKSAKSVDEPVSKSRSKSRNISKSKSSGLNVGERSKMRRKNIVAVPDSSDDETRENFVDRDIMISEVVMPGPSSDEDSVPLRARLRSKTGTECAQHKGGNSSRLDLDRSNLNRSARNNQSCNNESSFLASRRSVTNASDSRKEVFSANEREALERVEATELGETVIEWARELECLRAKCSNIQGGISGRMKKNIKKILEGTSMLVSRVMVTGDPVFLRSRHRDVCVRVKELEAENSKLKEDVKKLSNAFAKKEKKPANDSTTQMQMVPPSRVSPGAVAPSRSDPV